jgi:hypothetical protein
MKQKECGASVGIEIRRDVIPMVRVFASGPRNLPENGPCEGDPSLRLKNGSARDDAIEALLNSNRDFTRRNDC